MGKLNPKILKANTNSVILPGNASQVLNKANTSSTSKTEKPVSFLQKGSGRDSSRGRGLGLLTNSSEKNFEINSSTKNKNEMSTHSGNNMRLESNDNSK